MIHSGAFRRRQDAAVIVTALVAAVLRAVASPGVGDYPTDAGPALSAAAHGSLAGFFSHQPQMGAVSLYVRIPFVLLAHAFGASPVGTYRWGVLPCLLVLAGAAVATVHMAAGRGMRPVGQLLILAVFFLNPAVADALYWGHPEDLMTAGFVLLALVATVGQRSLTAAVLCGLAIATKQWAIVIACPLLLTLVARRAAAGILILGVAAGATLPMLCVDPASFMRMLHWISHPQPWTSPQSWVYPVAPTGWMTQANMFGDVRHLIGHRAPSSLTAVSHPLIVSLSVLVPVVVWLVRRRPLNPRQLFELCALALLLRCTLDPESMSYYHLPFLLVLVGLDALAGRRVPACGLLGSTGAFVVLDRVAYYLPATAANAAYIAVSVTVALLLIRSIVSGVEHVADRPLGDLDRLGELGGIAPAGPG